jgi:hypothetical protein
MGQHRFMSTDDDPPTPATPRPVPDTPRIAVDPEQALLAEVRSETDLVKLRKWAQDSYVPILLAVLENPHADDSVLHLIDPDHDVVESALLAHPRCPPTVIERLATSRWPTVRQQVPPAAKAYRRRRAAEAAQAATGITPDPVMTRMAEADRRRSAPKPITPWRFHVQPYSSEDWSAWMDAQPDARYDDMPAAIYEDETPYEDLVFDLSESGTRAYLMTDPIADGPDPAYIVERIVASHPRTTTLLAERVAAKLVSDATARATLGAERVRKRPDGTPVELTRDLAPLVQALNAVVIRPDVENKVLKPLLDTKVPEIRNLVALSPRAHTRDLWALADSVTALHYIAAHPTERVRELETVLLDTSTVLGPYLYVRRLLAANEHASDAAIADIWASGSHHELLGLAENPKLDTSMRLALAEDHHDFEVHMVLAMNENTPDEVLEDWADHDEPAMRATVARNPGTPKGVLVDRVATETVPRVLDALASNPRLPVEAMRTLWAQGYLTGLALNPRLPPNGQRAIATGTDPQARYHLARNPKAQPDLLALLVDPARHVWYAMDDAGRRNQLRIWRTVARHPTAPVDALTFLATSHDLRTRIAATVALHNPTT